MKQEFINWLNHHPRRYTPNTIYSYSTAIHRISRHYSDNIGENIDIYAVINPAIINQIAADYSQHGRFADFGERGDAIEGNGTNRNAIARYAEFFAQRNTPPPLPEENNEANSNSEVESGQTNFAYERDLQKALCAQIPELFPGYRIFGGYNRGVEYPINGGRIDVLLENADTNELLVVEVKSGVADDRVFGQISRYIGSLQRQFPDKSISGVIVAGAIDDGLRDACLTNDKITLKIYKMHINLEDA